MKKCIIFCAGGFDSLAEPITKEDLVIAADGGVRHTAALGIAPQIVLGDFDSLGKSIGKDSKENKLTCIRLYGLEGAKVRAEMCAQDCHAVLEGVEGDVSFLNALIDYVLKRGN